jgi:hypothetical protein
MWILTFYDGSVMSGCGFAMLLGQDEDVTIMAAITDAFVSG